MAKILHLVGKAEYSIFLSLNLFLPPLWLGHWRGSQPAGLEGKIPEMPESTALCSTASSFLWSNQNSPVSTPKTLLFLLTLNIRLPSTRKLLNRTQQEKDQCLVEKELGCVTVHVLTNVTSSGRPLSVDQGLTFTSLVPYFSLETPLPLGILSLQRLSLLGATTASVQCIP